MIFVWWLSFLIKQQTQHPAPPPWCQPWSSPHCLLVVTLPHLGSILHSAARGMLGECESDHDSNPQVLPCLTWNKVKKFFPWPTRKLPWLPSFSPGLPAPALLASYQLLLHSAEYNPTPGLLHFLSLPETSFSSYLPGSLPHSNSTQTAPLRPSYLREHAHTHLVIPYPLPHFLIFTVLINIWHTMHLFIYCLSPNSRMKVPWGQGYYLICTLLYSQNSEQNRAWHVVDTQYLLCVCAYSHLYI